MHPTVVILSFRVMAFSDSLSTMSNSKHVTYRAGFPSGAGYRTSYFDCNSLEMSQRESSKYTSEGSFNDDNDSAVLMKGRWG